MNQLTTKVAHHGNEKLAGRESKPNNQMRLKTYHSNVVYCGMFHSRDSRLHPTIQPTEGMIDLPIGLGYRRLLPIIDHFRDGLLHHLHNSHIGRKGCHRDVAFRPRITLSSVDDEFVGNTRGLVNFTTHGVESGSDAATINGSSKRLEGESKKR
jgi:hypothetical protein